MFEKAKMMLSPLYTGEAKLGKARVPKAVLIGVVGVAIIYLSAAGIVAAATPWWTGKGDTAAHVDHVWRVYHGQLPRFTDGIEYKPFIELGIPHTFQTTSMHPPLFYVILAPFMGPSLDGGNWRQAIAIGRAINILFGLGCVVALAYAGWYFGGKQRGIFAVGLPMLGTLTDRFLILNFDFANDALMVVFSVLTFVVIAKILERGYERKLLIPLGMLSVLGMATRAQYAVVLLVSLVALLAVPFVQKSNMRVSKESLIRAVITSGALLLLVIVAIGWFYYFWNYQSSGAWFRSAPHGYTGGRAYNSLHSVLFGSKLWELFYARYAAIPLISIVMTSFAVAGVMSIKKRELQSLLADKGRTILFALMIVAVGGFLATQIVEVVGHGIVNFRYLLGAILPITLFLTYGLTRFVWTRGFLVYIFGAGMVLSTIKLLPRNSYITSTLGNIDSAGGGFSRLQYAMIHNGFPAATVDVLFALLAAGLLTVPIALFLMSHNTTKSSSRIPNKRVLTHA